MLNLRELSEALQELGSAANQEDVSALAGRKGSWLSSTIAHQRRASTASLVALLFNLRSILAETQAAAAEAVDDDEREAFKAGAEDLQAWVQRIEDELTRRIEHHET